MSPFVMGLIVGFAFGSVFGMGVLGLAIAADHGDRLMREAQEEDEGTVIAIPDWVGEIDQR